jgi:alkylation response protein AidB-like acyl-CoA dehydrogenase
MAYGLIGYGRADSTAPMDFRPSPEQELLRSSVAKIAGAYGHEYFQERTASGGKQDALWHELGRAGFLGVHLPQQYGGGGMGMAELAIVCEEVAAAGCPLLLMLVSPAICGTVISRFGSEELRRHFLPQMAAGTTKLAFAITEPDAGSNSHRITTAAWLDGDIWHLTGTKYYISGVDEAAAILVVARTGTEEQTGHARLSLFIVDTEADGLEAAHIPVEIAAPEKQFTVFFDDVLVPTERLLGTAGEGLRQVFEGLNPERLMSAALSCGIGRYALGKAARYVRERSVWGRPIGAHQGVAHPLAKAKVELELARLMLEKAAWCYDQGVAAGEMANIAKFAAAEASLGALDQAVQTHGGNGFASEFGLADLWGTARLLRTAPVSREMILNFVAQHSLELPKSY